MNKTDEVRPELGLCQDHDLGFQDAQIRPNRECKVQGKVEDIFSAEPFGRNFLARLRRRRNYNPSIWHPRAQSCNQLTDSQRLPHRYSVNPDHRPDVLTDDPIWNSPESLRESGAILSQTR